MTRRNATTIRRRQLGRTMRELREATGLSVETAAPRLDWSSSKLSRVENGQQVLDVHGARSMLDLYNAADRWDEIIELTRQALRKGWWRAYGLDDQGFVPLEAEATVVRAYTLGSVPGLLQTEDYARAMFQGAVMGRTHEGLDNEVEVRLIRQRRLVSKDDPLELVAIMDESVLHRSIGGPEVMRAQLAHLIEAAGLERVTYQVIPLSTGTRPALSAGFIVLSFDTLAMPDLAYVEHPMGAVHTEKEAEVARATLAFDHLRSLALSPTDSVALIRRVVEQT